MDCGVVDKVVAEIFFVWFTGSRWKGGSRLRWWDSRGGRRCGVRRRAGERTCR